jgi:23S rRNA pseudouridine1911/1915/1917 synthase
MAVDPVHGKPSSTFYVVAERYDRFSVVRAHPRSGRTHQIRVHLTSIGHPIVADASYARRTNLSMSEIAPQLPELDRVLIHRQALHAHKLTFRHPRTDERVTFMAEIPDDMATVLEALRRYGRL